MLIDHRVEQETVLIEKVKQKDKIAFKKLYDQYLNRIFALTLRLTGDIDQAEEITQETFIKVWEKIYQFKGNSSFLTWITSIAINMTNRFWRNLKRKRTISKAYLESIKQTYNNSDYLQEEMIDLEKAIQKLPAQARKVFVLFEIQKCSHQEIAKLLKISEGTSKAHLFRAKKLLKKELHQ